MAGNTHGPSQASTILPATRQPFLPHPTNAPSARVRGNLDGTIAHKSVVSSVHARADGGGKEQAVRQDVQQNGVHGDHSPSALDVLAIAAATFPQDTVGSKRKAVGGAGQRSKRVAANKVCVSRVHVYACKYHPVCRHPPAQPPRYKRPQKTALIPIKNKSHTKATQYTACRSPYLPLSPSSLPFEH